MDERYNVYFAGQIIDGHDPGSVRENLGKVFNADQAILDKLFSGKPQLVKRDCDTATAAKYKQALERAGAVAIIKRVVEKQEASTAKGAAERPMSKAEKIAALAAAPDEALYRKSEAPTPSEAPSEADPDPDGISLSPAGTEVLRAEERAPPVIRDVDTSSLQLDTAAKRLSEVQPPPPPAPDTQHLSMGAVGDSIPNLASAATPLSPDIEGIALAEAGTDFTDCARPEPGVPDINLSHLDALPPGEMPQDEQQRKPMPVATPSTEHLTLED